MHVMPDIDQHLVDYLTTHPALAPFHAGRVGTQLADGQDPAVRTSSLGGVQAWPWEGTGEFAIEWWGGDQGQASTLCRTGEAVLWQITGPVPGGHIRGVSVQLSQLWSPDPNTGRARYITHTQFEIYPEGS